MNYLKKFGISSKQINELKEKYNEGIIEFITNNEIFVIDIIKYLYSENITYIYLLMNNNIKIFLETKISLQKKINKMKKDGFSVKAMVMKLIED